MFSVTLASTVMQVAGTIDYYKLKKNVKDENNGKFNPLRNNFLVFYQSGKIGRFLDYDEKGFDFNPQKAEMGYYGTKKGRYFMKFKVQYPSILKTEEKEIVFLDKDSIIVYTSKSALGGDFLSKYYKVNPKEFNNQQSPDW